jgi:subtilisin family serine protease
MWENSGEVSDGVDNDGNGFVDDLIGWDFVEEDNDPSTISSHTSHGTWVSGVLGAGANGLGTMGVAPQVTIMPVRVCATGCGLLDVALGIDYTVKNGADVINLSLGAMVPVAHVINDPLTAAIADANSAGVLVVAAAGNSSSNIEQDPNQVLTPGGLDFDNIITTAATTRNDTLASFSAWGPTQVDIGGPGEEILTTSGPSGYTEVDGTSFSSPTVAGAAAIFLSLHPTAAPTTTIAFLLEGAREAPDLISKTVSGATLDIGATLGLSPFIDSWESIYVDDISWISAEGITTGCNPPANTLYCPEGLLTRGQMAAFLVKALGLNPTATNFFSDDDGTLFESDIDKLAAAGITSGCGVEAFCPDDLVTRGQMAAFITRALDFDDSGEGDLFVDDDGQTFEGNIDRLATAGVTYGCNPPTNNRYCPDEPVIRGQMAAFLRRSLER